MKNSAISGTCRRSCRQITCTWVAMSLGVIYLVEQRSLKLWLINSGYQVLAYTLMGGLIGLWK